MVEKEINDRRHFLKNVAAFSTIAAFGPGFLSAMYPGKKINGDGFTILFQGDSITDGNRSRNNDWNHVMGHGYQYIISSRLWYEFPGKRLHFFNRGVSGNKVTDLAVRWQQDTIELKPDLLSILVGINDISALINGDKDFTAAQYEKDYRSLLQQTRQQLPGIQFVLCEPFILPVGKVKENWDAYFNEVEKRREIVLRMSKEYNAVFAAFQAAFNKALSLAPADYWIWDGIHPMPAGHELMAREWMQQVNKKIKFTGSASGKQAHQIK